MTRAPGAAEKARARVTRGGTQDTGRGAGGRQRTGARGGGREGDKGQGRGG